MNIVFSSHCWNSSQPLRYLEVVGMVNIVFWRSEKINLSFTFFNQNVKHLTVSKTDNLNDIQSSLVNTV